ncbi:hypothetical protein VitviT2T_021807 [Vitis vinifera]|uniref:S-adenosylmethionine-dependent methyltransferase n=2 Tax=Vitis vinifera TaxID=29760 RepID=A0ABY9D9C0_VITVI|nr:hypothetical protein VitviT2T_021807 [Vitis vinifera]
MANEETKIVLEGESADGETNILLKKESANGETKLYCMDSGDGPYSYARCSCSQKDLVDAATKEMENEDSKMLQEKEMTNGKTKMLMDKEVSNGESYHMNSGDGPYSYAKYSSYQKAIVDAAKKMLVEAISDNLDINNPSFGSSNTLRIADMGCSIGPNAFIAVQNIVEAVTLKYQSMQQKPQALEFHVFFNDHIANDFNALFRSLPPSRPYFAVGVPGSFHGRLFPKSSLHIVHSSYALHWLSKVPKEVMEINFLGLKNGRNYSTTDEEVLEVFSSQYKRDMQSFLTARAQELVGGGLMVLLVTGMQNGAIFSKTCSGMVFNLFGSCLMDMANAGLVSNEKVYSFHFPLYYTTPKELEALIETNGYFNIERIEILARPLEHELPDYRICSFHLRAAMEGLVEEHFGKEIIEDLFERYTNKLGENSFIFDEEYRKETHLFVFLRRKITEYSSEEKPEAEIGSEEGKKTLNQQLDV